MAKIVQITNETVCIGLDDGNIREVSIQCLNFTPSVNDEVQIFEKEDKIIVTKVEKEPANANPQQIIINNSNNNVNENVNIAAVQGKKPKKKWVAFCLCLFLGWLGGHKFYEGKVGMGILYLFTMGLFFIGVVIDLVAILMKPDPYYV